ncbi:MAG: glycosyltransferase [Acidobacteriota bacterium]
MIDTSIIVPSLDSPWIERTLAGLRREGAPGDSVEVVVVGRDSAAQIPRDGSVRFFPTEQPLNPAAARNLAIAKARGDKLILIDADCRPLTGWLDRQRANLEHHPVAGGAVTFPRQGSRWALADNIASFHGLLADRPADSATEGPLGTLNLAIQRAAWERVGGFDEALTTSEDFDWVLRCRRAGLTTAFDPTAVVEHAAVRESRQDLERHATWYGRNFHDFARRHPQAFGTGPTWSSRRALALTAPLKAYAAAYDIYRRNPSLRDARRAFGGVVHFKRVWYRTVVATWPDHQPPPAGDSDGR